MFENHNCWTQYRWWRSAPSQVEPQGSGAMQANCAGDDETMAMVPGEPWTVGSPETRPEGLPLHVNMVDRWVEVLVDKSTVELVTTTFIEVNYWIYWWFSMGGWPRQISSNIHEPFTSTINHWAWTGPQPEPTRLAASKRRGSSPNRVVVGWLVVGDDGWWLMMADKLSNGWLIIQALQLSLAFLS